MLLQWHYPISWESFSFYDSTSDMSLSDFPQFTRSCEILSLHPRWKSSRKVIDLHNELRCSKTRLFLNFINLIKAWDVGWSGAPFAKLKEKVISQREQNAILFQRGHYNGPLGALEIYFFWGLLSSQQFVLRIYFDLFFPPPKRHMRGKFGLYSPTLTRLVCGFYMVSNADWPISFYQSLERINILSPAKQCLEH